MTDNDRSYVSGSFESATPASVLILILAVIAIACMSAVTFVNRWALGLR